MASYYKLLPFATYYLWNYLYELRIFFNYNSKAKYKSKLATESRVTKKYLYTHVHSSIIHNSWKEEVTQVSTKGSKDKPTVVYTYNGIFFSLNKEGNSDNCYNVVERWGHYAKWNNLGTKEQTNTVWFCYTRYIE